jgi:deoxyribodipyrimidine photolyase-related protein
MTAPGDWRVLQALKAVAAAWPAAGLREDRHFFCSVREFAAHAKGRKRCAWSTSTASMRQRHGVLMDPAGREARWAASGTSTPTTARPSAPRARGACRRAPLRARCVTREVIALVEQRFAAAPGLGWTASPGR